jgi:glycosyltransferase involved in cell wall biosynthesis
LRLLVLSRYARLGASSRLRILQYLPYLEARGVEPVVAPFFDDAYVARRNSGERPLFSGVLASYLGRLKRLRGIRRFDLLWVEYELWPSLPALFERVLVRSRVPYVVDYDDAIFHRYDGNPRMLVRAFLREKIRAVMRGARTVIAGNAYLASYARDSGAARIEVLPTVVDLSRYACDSVRRREEVTIGWIGSGSTARYLELVRRPLEEACRSGRARVVVLGGQKPSLGDLPVEFHRWSEDTEADEISRFDVGIMPLPDTPWERGKCGYKLLQYMACGKPVVASPVGANREIVRHGENGLLASGEEEWAKALVTLRDDEPLRRRLGAAGRATVEERYSLDRAAPRLWALLQEAADDA